MNKKVIFVTLYILFFLLSPVFAADWVYLGNLIFLDMASISKYNHIYGQNNIYSIWTQDYSHGGEITLNKKEIYRLYMYLINCRTKEATLKSLVIYNKPYNIILSNTWKDYELDWNPIVPNSIGETLYSYVCQEK